MEFVYNDGGRSKYFKATNVGDCATRAIANATGADYKLVYKALSKIEGKPVRNGCLKKTDKKLLTMLGWKWTPTMVVGGGCRTHLCKEELPSGTLVVQVSSHLTCVVEGTIYDTYNCSRGENRCVYGYWKEDRPRSTEYYEGIIRDFLGVKVIKKEKVAAKKKRANKRKSPVSMATKIARLERRIEKLEALLKEVKK